MAPAPPSAAAGRLNRNAMTHPQVRTDTRGAVRLVFVDNPPVNTLTATVAEGPALSPGRGE